MDTQTNPPHNVDTAKALAEGLMQPPGGALDASTKPEASPQAPETSTVEAEGKKLEADKPREQDDRLSGKFVELARRERELHRLKAEIEQQQKKIPDEGQLKKRFQNDPEYLLEYAGWSIEELTAALMTGKAPESRRLRNLEKQIEEDRTRRQEDETKRRDEEATRQIDAFKFQIKNTIAKGGEKYELIEAFGAHEKVFELISKVFDESKDILPVEEAAALIEQQIEKNELPKYLNKSKIRKFFTPAQKAENIEEEPGRLAEALQKEEQRRTEVTPSTHSKTLTNSLTTAATTNAPRRLSRDEEIRLAAQMLIRK